MTDERRAWQNVLTHIESQLVDGRLRPGDRLPPERVLAFDLAVGRSSVREAMRVLEVMGLVRTQTGSGPTSGAIIVARPVGGMQALMRLQVAAAGFPVADVVRTRLILETATAAELASRAADPTPAPAELASRAADLSPAIELLDAMDAPGLAREEFLALDAQFHVALADASGNQVVSAMMAGLRSSIESYVQLAASSVDDWPGMAARLRAEHRAIVAAIVAGDPAVARTQVHDHITGYYRDTHLTAAIAGHDHATHSPDRTPHHG